MKDQRKMKSITKIKTSFDLARKIKYIRITDKNFKPLMKEIHNALLEFKDDTYLMCSNVKEIIQDYKTRRKLRCCRSHLERFIERVEFNIENPNYARTPRIDKE